MCTSFLSTLSQHYGNLPLQIIRQNPPNTHVLPDTILPGTDYEFLEAIGYEAACQIRGQWLKLTSLLFLCILSTGSECKNTNRPCPEAFGWSKCRMGCWLFGSINKCGIGQPARWLRHGQHILGSNSKSGPQGIFYHRS